MAGRVRSLNRLSRGKKQRRSTCPQSVLLPSAEGVNKLKLKPTPVPYDTGVPRHRSQAQEHGRAAKTSMPRKPSFAARGVLAFKHQFWTMAFRREKFRWVRPFVHLSPTSKLLPPFPWWHVLWHRRERLTLF